MMMQSFQKPLSASKKYYAYFLQKIQLLSKGLKLIYPGV